MFGRIKNRLSDRMSRTSSLSMETISDVGSSSNSSRVRNSHHHVFQPVGTESSLDHHAKLSDLASFDACVEACDALAASASLSQSSFVDPQTGLKDCSVLVSADGDLVLMPQQKKEEKVVQTFKSDLDGAVDEKNMDSRQTEDDEEGVADEDSYHSEEGKDQNGKTQTTQTENADNDLAQNSKTDLSISVANESKADQSLTLDDVMDPLDDSDNQLTTEMLENAYHDTAVVVMGNDLKPDREINGFSAMGWSAAASTLAIRQTHASLSHLHHYMDQVLLSRQEAQDRVRFNSQALREVAGIGEIAPPQVPPTPLPAVLRKSRRNKHNGVDLTSLSDVEPTGSSWNHDKGGNYLEMAPHRVGPLRYTRGTLFGALVALDQYYSQNSAVHFNQPMQDLARSIENAAERAYHREKALKETQRKVKEMESRLVYAKHNSSRRWDMVHRAEETVTQIMEQRLLERSRARERQRMEELERQEAEAQKGAVQFATESEIWDIVAAHTASLEEGDFSPLDFPSAPTAPVRDRSSSTVPKDEKQEAIAPEVSSNGINGEGMDLSSGSRTSNTQQHSVPLASRNEIEQDVNLPELLAAALAADEAVEYAAQALLNVLSTLDTTRRSARIAAETNLLSGCQAQAKALREIARLERAALEERMDSLKDLEAAVERIDVRKDLDQYIRIDKNQRGGSTWLDLYDDGGMAAALAVLASHVEGSVGMGPGSPSKMSSWNEEDGGEPNKDTSVTTEELEDAINEFFEDNPHLRSDTSNDDKTIQAQAEFEETVQLLCRIASDQNPIFRSKRSAICYALNSKRTSAECKTPIQFEALCRVFDSILSGCDSESGGVANAKMCMMLSQTFYIVDSDNDVSPRENGSSPSRAHRSRRNYVKSMLIGHPLWEEDEFWDQALYQCVAESLTHSGVMQNYERASSRQGKNSGNSEWSQQKKLLWHDLNHAERSEAATQVHAVVFAQLGALAHSMMEFGCGTKRACAFVRRMCVRNQLPISQRSMLLSHLMGKKNY